MSTGHAVEVHSALRLLDRAAGHAYCLMFWCEVKYYKQLTLTETLP